MRMTQWFAAELEGEGLALEGFFFLFFLMILARNGFCLFDCSTGKKRWGNLFERNPIKLSRLVNVGREN